MSLKSQKLDRTLGAIAVSGAGESGDTANISQLITAGAGAAASQTIAPPAITPRYGGLMFVVAGMTVSGSTSDIVTFQLKRGATTLAQRRVTSDATNGLASASFSIYDPLPATSATSYSIVATPATGNVAIAANEGSVSVMEVGS